MSVRIPPGKTSSISNPMEATKIRTQTTHRILLILLRVVLSFVLAHAHGEALVELPHLPVVVIYLVVRDAAVCVDILFASDAPTICCHKLVLS